MATTEPHVKRWTRDEYYKMGDAGLFEGKRVELIDGEIIEMSPANHPHVLALSKTTNVLMYIFSGRYWVRSQAPLLITGTSEPEPDVAVVAGAMTEHSDHPRTALLVVEVADSTLAYDRSTKASLYAAAGIQEYWILNLVDRQLEIYRDPKGSYASKTFLKDGASVTPLAAPQAVIAISDLLP
jgi:Uma2 family endonuclease